MFTKEDIGYMQRALILARQADGCTSPNPMVGAVLVKNGEVVGEGYHEQAGQAHAEVRAVAAAGASAQGSTLYINLEPCCHHGKTPPCVDTLVANGIIKAFVAMVDPNPLVAGQGIECLRRAGIEVEIGLLENEARLLNEAFVKYIQTHRPFVVLKTAMTLDGKIATSSGDSRWVSNEKSRAYVHKLRNNIDAILVGIGTILKDDPLLNTRLDGRQGKNPLRVIVDGNLDIPLSSRIVATAGDISTMVFCSHAADYGRENELQALGLEVIRIPGEIDSLDLFAILNLLGSRHIISVLVEGGSHINASFLDAGLVDKIIWFIAPKIVGGNDAPSPVGGRGVNKMNEAIELHHVEVRNLDKDLCLTAYVKHIFSDVKRG